MRQHEGKYCGGDAAVKIKTHSETGKAQYDAMDDDERYGGRDGSGEFRYESRPARGMQYLLNTEPHGDEAEDDR